MPDIPDMSDFDPKRDLYRIQCYAQYALDALKDEHEGNFKHNIDQVMELAKKLQTQAHYM